MAVPEPPMGLGRRLLPSLLDQIAQTEPNRVLYSIATSNPADGFQDITAKSFAEAVDRCAWHIDKHLGRGVGFPTLTYMGPQDLVYAILVTASIKSGYKLLLNSPRNTLEAHLSLFEETECHTFLLPPKFPLPVVKQILEARPMKVVEIPGTQHWIKDEPVTPYPYAKSFAEARSEPFVILHTSGSTGMPKPIVQTHGTLSPLDAFTALPSLGMHPSYPAMCAGTRVYLAFPLFHCAGMSMLLPGSIYSGFTVVLGPFPPSAEVANGIHCHGNVQHSCLAPMTLVDLARNPEHLTNLARLKQITFGGGPLPQGVGEVVSKHTRLLNCLGTTEAGVLPALLCDAEDWSYMAVSPALGHTYRHVSDDLYEQVIVRDPKLDLYQGIFQTFPHLTEWPMKDLYSKHPTKENVWLYRGRADDIIVFSTGEKLNPVEMENIIGAHPDVSAALIVGLGRFQSSLLVEGVKPLTTQEEKNGLLDAIWPVVQTANKQSPSYGIIHRHMIAFTSADKPMLRAGKGTVQRKSTVNAYAPEIDQLYKANEGAITGHTSGVMDSHTSLPDAVRRVVGASTNINTDELGLETNLFDVGLDSLQVTVITREINKFLSTGGRPRRLAASNVYSNPTLDGLIAAVSALSQGETLVQDAASIEQKIQNLYDLHASNLPLSSRQPQAQPTDEFTILLTGATGSIGSYILDALLKDPRVSRIYCLSRGPGASQRQQKIQASRGLHELSHKVHTLEADFSAPYFGLQRDKYRSLLDSVTVVIHAAWQVDFNLPIDSFVTQIAATRKLIDFSSNSCFGARLVFISSSSTVANYQAVVDRPGDIPETVNRDWRVAQPIGYAQSKLVAERLLDAACTETGIPTTICRVGQAGGPIRTEGVWPKQEWLPSLLASSKEMGKLPSSLGQMETVDWVPVDVLGGVLAEIATTAASTPTSEATIYNIVNPQRTHWSKLIDTTSRALAPEGIEIVPLEAWVDALRDSVSTTNDVSRNPAIKILDFFEDIVGKSESPVLLDTKNAVLASKTLANLGPVRDVWMENWMRQWSF